MTRIFLILSLLVSQSVYAEHVEGDCSNSKDRFTAYFCKEILPMYEQEMVRETEEINRLKEKYPHLSEESEEISEIRQMIAEVKRAYKDNMMKSHMQLCYSEGQMSYMGYTGDEEYYEELRCLRIHELNTLEYELMELRREKYKKITEPKQP